VRIVRDDGRSGSLPPSGVTVDAEGRSPTVHLRPLLGLDAAPVGTLALSRDPEVTLRAQREALTALLLTALVTTAVVAGLAVLLGRRTVNPVRQLTAAAERVTAGDLGATAGQAGPDEVGTLSRAFDTMTGTLARVTGDLRSSNARLETVLSSMADGLVATDGLGRVTSINRAALAMAGLPDDADAVGRRLADVLDARDASGARLTSSGELLADAAVEVHSPDGTTTPVQVAAAPLESGGETSGGLVIVLRDTTREREVERMKTEFLSNVSHELRTPLTPIRGYADLLASRRTLTPDQVATFAGTILAESVKMNRVVDLLVDVAAIEAGRVTTSPRPVAPRELLDTRLEVWRKRAPERSADLHRRAAARLPRVLVDPTWVGKALDELIDNAVKYTPPGTRITLSAAPSADGDAVRVAVRDAGPGIAAGDQGVLLQSFAQVDGSATRRVGGLGLGLSFVRRLAEDAGYRLTVTSTLGRGRSSRSTCRWPPPTPRPSPAYDGRGSALVQHREQRLRQRRGQVRAGDALVLRVIRAAQAQHAGLTAAAHHARRPCARRAGRGARPRPPPGPRRRPAAPPPTGGRTTTSCASTTPSTSSPKTTPASCSSSGPSDSGSCATGVSAPGMPPTSPIVCASCGSARSSCSVSTSANSWGGWSQPASATCPSTSPTTSCRGSRITCGCSSMRPSSRTAAGTGRDPARRSAATGGTRRVWKG
jgi:PAS domain S-box-containing protein